MTILWRSCSERSSKDVQRRARSETSELTFSQKVKTQRSQCSLGTPAPPSARPVCLELARGPRLLAQRRRTCNVPHGGHAATHGALPQRRLCRPARVPAREPTPLPTVPSRRAVLPLLLPQRPRGCWQSSRDSSTGRIQWRARAITGEGHPNGRVVGLVWWPFALFPSLSFQDEGFPWVGLLTAIGTNTPPPSRKPLVHVYFWNELG
jgi:hypothetical protein